MQDDISTIPKAPRARRSGAALGFVALLSFAAGAAGIGALAWYGELDRFLPSREGQAGPSSQQSSPAVGAPIPDAAAIGPMETRLALLEDRFSRISFAADTAAGNAARAEGLLIVLSTRRLIDRGQPLGYVSDQLRLRFSDAQPNAVETILAFARAPVTIDQLSARLEALSPDLTDAAQDLSTWQRLRQEVTGLFIVRRDSSTLSAPTARIERARLMLAAGRTGSAIDEVSRLPGADHADKWMEDARRYEAAQRALDLVETTAMLEPRNLRDGARRPVTETSPLAAPTVPVDQEPAAEASEVVPE